MEKTVPAGKTN